MIAHQLEPDGIETVAYERGQRIEATDFLDLALEMDPYVQKHGALEGLLVESDQVPHWNDLGAAIAHLRFVRNHLKVIRKVAFVTSSRAVSAMQFFLGRLLPTKVKAFSPAEKEQALGWLRAGNGPE